MSGKPIDEAALTTVSFLDGGVVQMDRADYDRLTAAQQQGQAKGCHCATCTCQPGMTPAVRFDTTPADKEGAVRDHLIALGWTPPGAQQKGQAVAEVVQEADGVNLRFVGPILPAGTKLYTAPPPSAPVGVEARAFALWHPERKEYGNVIVGDPSLLREDYKEHGYIIVALAQQPAAVDGAATNSAVAAIQFALTDPEGMTFLRLWSEGEFDTLRR